MGRGGGRFNAKVFGRPSLFFIGKGWPIAGGAGFGAGMAFADCQHDFSHATFLHGKVLSCVHFSF